jgi:DNA-binding NtrC family response regulator
MKDVILIVEDEIDLLHGLQRTIAMEIDCEVLIADNSYDALKILKEKSVDVVLADIRMPDMDGMELLRETMKIDPSITVVMMTAYGSIEQAVQAIKDGAYDFITKPFDGEQMIHLLRKGLERNRLVRENALLREQVRNQVSFQDMVGKSAKMHKVFETIQILARTDVTVLILGESGTGKEMAARAVHGLSKRHHHSMVTVNCPALPENILESELFGYRKGAFTNAVSDKKGLFEEADGSTIFLDEIGDLSLSLQTKLLRVLQEKEIKLLGDNKTRKVDVRIIASTNQDLKKKMDHGTLREDLYYRLNVATLTMPPLREMKEDIPLLAEHFLKKAARELDVPRKKLTLQAMNELLARDWHGNIRELENTIRGITAMCPGVTVDVNNLPLCEPSERIPGLTYSQNISMEDMDLSLPYKALKNRLLEEFTTTYISNLLERTNGNVTLAAETSGIKRQSLQKIIKKYKIDTESFRS